MSSMDSLAILVGQINRGEFDADLQYVARAVRERGDTLARSMLYTLRPGDMIRFNDKTRPAYLRGITARVKHVNRESVAVELEESQGRFRAGHSIRVPAALLEKVA